MLKVGLTGGIAVGKSHVSRYLSELGCHVFDADQIARDVVEPGTPALTEIVETFGPEVLTEAGTLDRQKLGAIVFSNSDLRQKLNAIVHPKVKAEQDRLMAEVARRDPTGVAVVDAALLIESGGYKRFDKVVVVWCPRREQLKRLMKRNQLTRAQALERINAQMPASQKRRYADFVIDTSGTVEETRRRTELVFDELKKRATQSAPPPV